MSRVKFWFQVLILAWVAVPGLFAQTAELPFYWAHLRPAAQPESWVVVDLRVHVLKDAAGAIDSGGACVRVRWDLKDPMTLTAVKIHRSSDNAAVFQATFASTAMRGAGSAMAGINDKIQVKRGDRAALEAFRRFLDDPYSHYVSVVTREQPESALRGPLWKVDCTVLMSMASTGPAIPAARGASAALEIDAFLARDAAGKVVFAEMLVQGTYHYPSQVTFTGLHLRAGANGTGPILMTAPFTTLASAASGSGDLPGLFIQIPAENEAAMRTVLELVRNPENFSVTLHAGTQPEEPLRGRLHRTGQMKFPLQFSSRNVVPPPAGMDNWSASVNTLFTLRRPDGSVAAATWLLHLVYRFPEPCELRSIQVYRGRAGASGPVVYPIVTAAATLTAGHYDLTGFRLNHFDDGELNDLINGIVERPEEYYMEAVTDKGAVRAQFGVMTQTPVIDAVVSANLDPASRTVAPGSLITIFGHNLAKVGSDLNGWEGQVIPEALNSVAVGTGAHRARLLYVSPAQINAQLPFELTPGAQQVAVNNGIGVSNEAPIQVAVTAPAIFPGAVLNRAGNALVTAGNPARPGDVLEVYLTGMGQTTPALGTGRLVDPAWTFRTAAVTATLGGIAAEVLSSTATAGFPGVYQVTLRVPTGAAAGNLPLILKSGDATSNTVNVAVR